jgi:Ribonuclease G/E
MVSQDCHIYIERTICEDVKIYRIFVYRQNYLQHIGVFTSDDLHNSICLGKVAQVFGNGKCVIETLEGIHVYAERSFKGKKLNVGENVYVQIHSISSLEMNEKHHKGTLNIGLPFGPIIFYPFEAGVYISNRLKHHPEYVHSLKQHFEERVNRCGIKFRVCAENYSLSELDNILSYVQGIWQVQHYNHINYKLLGWLLTNTLSKAIVYTNDVDLKLFLQLEVSALIPNSPPIKSMPIDCDFMYDDWDKACVTTVDLKQGSNLIIQETKACVVVDVNAGSAVSFDAVNDQVVQTLPKLLYQGRFGGKVVVDLLPISSKQEEKLLNEKFSNQWKEIDISVQTYGISKMGLLEFILPRQGCPLYQINKKFFKN